LIIISAGYDAHAADLLGGMRLQAGSFGHFAAQLAAVAREIEAAPLMLLLEGGYNLHALTDSVAATIKGVEAEEPPGWEYLGDARPVEAARRALAPFWGSLS
jgi:acetoin utilization deacetylase AcuC-like enzyme